MQVDVRSIIRSPTRCGGICPASFSTTRTPGAEPSWSRPGCRSAGSGSCVRLGPQSMTVKEVASAATIDAPAATVAVNDLEDRGLVVREIDPNNRRSKLVSLTDAGRDLVATVKAIDDPAPESLSALSDDERGGPRRPSSPRSSASGLASTAIAALCPPIPDTAPPRRDPEPHNKIRSWAVATPHCARACPAGRRLRRTASSSAPWKMLPPVICNVCSRSRVVFASTQGSPFASASHDILNRLGQNRIQRRKHRIGQSGPHDLGIVAGHAVSAGCAGRTPSASARRVA